MTELIPIVFFSAIAAVIGAFILTRHKERITIIEKGLKAEDYTALYRSAGKQVFPLSSLKWGLILLLIGVSVLVGLWLRQAYGVEEGVFFGLVALAAGIGLLIFYAIAKKQVQV
jgi:hypothetical protein